MMCSDPYVRVVVADVDVPGDGRRWWLQDCDGIPLQTSRDWSRAPADLADVLAGRAGVVSIGVGYFNSKRPSLRPSYVVIDDLDPTPRAIPFDDTPNPRTGEPGKSGIMIEVPAVGWPPHWSEDDDWAVNGAARLPYSEKGRRAAWAMVAR